MKLTKRQENEVLQVYNTWWKSYLSGDVKTYNLYLDKDFRFVGSTEAEAFLNKRNTTGFFEKTADQLAGKSALRNSVLKAEQFDGLVFITELADAYLLYDKQWTFYGKFRFSSVLRKNKEGWRFIYQHFSVPDSKVNEGETIGLEKITTENQELRDAIKRRTVELENKTRELEIETALERVRAVAMGMKKPEDMLDVCRVISQELKKLGVADIRNVQTAVIDESKGRYLNYEYFQLTKKKLVTAVEYKKQKDVAAFVRRMLGDTEGFFTKNFKAKDLEEWISYQEKSGQYVDPKTRKTASLHYYFYSIGPGALGISSYAPLSREAVDLFKRFRNVFLMAYRRFLDIEKAEAQAREAQIEAALERVRSRGMAMHKSDELLEAGEILCREMSKLGIGCLTSGYVLMDAEAKIGWNYTPHPATGKIMPEAVGIPHTETKPMKKVLASWKKQDPVCVIAMDEKETIAHQTFIAERSFNFPLTAKELIAITPPRLMLHNFNFKEGYLLIVGGVRLPEEHMDIMLRFTRVFQQTYTRFLDLQKAEAQAREAQIEAALERVRAKVMAMNSSNELNETSLVFGEQLRKLGIDWQFSYFWLIEEDKDDNTFWITWPDNKTSTTVYSLAEADENFRECIIAWKEQVKIHASYVPPEGVKAWLDTFERIKKDAGGAALEIMRPKNFKNGVYYFDAMIRFGSFGILINRLLSEEEMSIQTRFATEFERAYTRFLDLQKAEAQTREAQIELGLERVRARAMAMQRSDELAELVDTVFRELTKLDMALTWCMINVIDESTLSNTVWTVNAASGKIPESFYMKFEDYPFHHAMMKGWRERATKYVYVLEGKEKKVYDKYLFSETEFRKVPAAAQVASRAMEKYVCSFSFSNFGGLQTVGDAPLSEGSMDILSRFGKVFDLTYTRFNDLKQAEAQARESEIQLALERVRARTMAMQKSDELPQAANLLFQQIQALGMPAWSAGYCTWEDDKKAITLSMSSEGVLQPMIRMPLTEDPSLIHFRETHERGETFYVEELGGDELKRHYVYLRTLPGVKETLDDIEKAGFPVPTFQIFHCAYFSKGFLLFITYEPVPEAWDIFKRFAAVFEQTYTRFLDLQKAEAQAREAQIELSLERVRARTMAMHNSEELVDTSVILFQELRNLGVKAIRTGVAIIDSEKELMELWSSQLIEQKQNKVLGIVPMQSHPFFQGLLRAWRKKDHDYIFEFKGEKVKEFYENMSSLISYPAQNSYNPREIFSPFFFSEGSLTVVSHETLSGEERNIMRRFAKVFGLLYRRFLDLQKAEAQAKEAQIEVAMERIRARAMAMHSSGELMDVANVLREQMGLLNQPDLETSAVLIFHEDQETWDSWYAFRPTRDEGGSIRNGTAAFSKDDCALTREIVQHYRSPESDYTLEISGAKREEWLAVLMKAAPEVAKNAIQDETVNYDTTYFHFSDFHGGSLLTVSYLPPSEEIRLLQRRAASVFDLAYRRFRDLQKAEAQAREAQIEAALERVRSRTMGMQKSEELKEVIRVVYEQFVHLNILVEHAGFIMDYKERDDMHIWLADRHEVPFQVTIPYFDCAHWNSFNEAKEKGNDFFANHLGFEEKNKFYQELFTLFPVPDETREYYFNCPGLAISTVLLENVGLYIENFSGIPYTDVENNTLMRFGKVFQQTYTRFLDLQKAEAQAMESHIEAALERVRSRTMGMQQSHELGDVATVLFKELNQLVENLWTCGFVLCEKDRREDEWWLSSGDGFIPAFYLPNTGDRTHANIYNAWKKGETYHTEQLEGEDLQQHYDWLMNIPVSKSIFDEMKAAGHSLPLWQKLHCAYFSYGYLVMITQVPCPEEQVFKRFAQVFDQTYTRFLDLQKAEAQAREAKIEAALERTRTQSMLMQHSEQLDDTLRVFHEQVLLLGIKSAFSFLWLPDEKNDRHIFWAAWAEGHSGENVSAVFKSKAIDYPLDRNEPATAQCLVDWKSDQPVHAYHVPPAEVDNYFAAWKELLDGVEKLKPEYFRGGLYYVEAFMKYGCFGVMIECEMPEEEKKLLHRFAIEFERTYTRFLDLQKAEAQAREAQVELGLERVRARAMAMQKPEELRELIGTVFTELTKLDLALTRCLIMIYDAKTDGSTWWMANSEAPADPIGLVVQNHESPPYLAYLKAWKDKEMKWQYILEGAVKKEWDDFLFVETELSHLPDFVIAGMKAPEQVYLNASFNSFGNLTLATLEPLSNEHFDIMLRFAKVFDLTYTRFLDLQKAEAQAREAQIEASLERVRSKTMAMHNSTDVGDTVATMFGELVKLGVDKSIRCGIGILNDTKHMELWTASTSNSGETNLDIGLLDMTIHPLLSGVKEAWETKKTGFTYELMGDDLKNYFKAINETPDYPVHVDIETLPDKIFHKDFFFSDGTLFAFSPNSIPEDTVEVLKRFAGVFGQTYRRYLDLLKAEANAKEATIETSLERVRSKAMAMHSSQDLADTIGMFYQELQNFSITPRRCGVGLLNKEDRQGELFTWNTTEEGHSLELVGKVKMEGHPVLDNIYENWIAQSEYHPVLRGNEIREYYEIIRPQMGFPGYHQDDVQFGYFFFFPEGGVYAWTASEMSEEELAIYRRFTSVLSLTYKRYKDLQQAEALAQQAEKDLVLLKEEKKRTEEALAELQVTQRQLIQSEKMASLGELTAGIAHEIQNPLNFVNNFSEVSNELLDEMLEEAERGNFEEVKEILKDVKQNLEKINHHGKRADGIVKGMLQHSRSSSGQKEPTDINELADEYLRLAYHGLRAKDKSFNATMKTTYEEGLQKVNVIPQDIGRVVLNLITNAFYVVNEKKNSGIDAYEPTVTVATKKTGDKVELSVKDNGNGIPQKVLEKIFQPFFTTKPTGQGTGLGLSLSYDIVKAHGGEIKVETREGEGTEFIVQLPL